MQKLLPLLLISNIYAHDLYLMPQSFRPNAGDKILLSAHTGDSFPASEQGVDPARIATIPASSNSEWRILGKATHATVTAVEGSQFFALYTQPKYLELEPAKFISYLKEEGLRGPLASYKATANSREMYAKFAKTYVVAGKSSSAFSKPVGLKIEIVPLADPANLKPGHSLPVQLLFEGKPCVDTQIEIASSADLRSKATLKIAGRTDNQGKLNIPIANSGKIRLHAVHMLQVQQPKHDWESYWASLTFEVASAAPVQSSNLTNR